jgi:hypothetical protein
MLTAVDFKTQIQNDYYVETEIYLLNVAILLNALYGGGSTVITFKRDTEVPVNETTVTGSPMTTGAAYYSVWQGTVIDNRLTLEMNKVIDYYKKLGYTINRKTDDMEHLYWQITL